MTLDDYTIYQRPEHPKRGSAARGLCFWPVRERNAKDRRIRPSINPRIHSGGTAWRRMPPDDATYMYHIDAR